MEPLVDRLELLNEFVLLLLQKRRFLSLLKALTALVLSLLLLPGFRLVLLET